MINYNDNTNKMEGKTANNPQWGAQFDDHIVIPTIIIY